MANLAKSKNRFDIFMPRDIRHIQREGRASLDSEFQAGDLVCRRNGRLELCDPDADPFFETAPVELVWTDGRHRVDKERVRLDGTREKEYSTIAMSCFATIDEELIDLDNSTPANVSEGQLLMKGPEGKMLVGDLADLAGDYHLVVGHVEEEKTDGKYVARFTL